MKVIVNNNINEPTEIKSWVLGKNENKCVSVDYDGLAYILELTPKPVIRVYTLSKDGELLDLISEEPIKNY